MKILASDFDGTLQVNGKISQENKKAIKQFQKDGNWFGVCTGRVLAGVEAQEEDLALDFYILNTGAIIVDKNKKDIIRHGFPVTIADEIGEMVGPKADVICFYDRIAYIYKQKSNTHGLGGFPIVTVDSFLETGATQLEAISVLFKCEEDARVFVNPINEKYNGLCSAHQNVDAIDIVAPNCSKGTGILDLQKYYDLDPTMICGIGDSYNDIAMFDVITHSFSFPYAPMEVQNKAKYIVKDIAEAISIINTL